MRGKVIDLIFRENRQAVTARISNGEIYPVKLVNMPSGMVLKMKMSDQIIRRYVIGHPHNSVNSASVLLWSRGSVMLYRFKAVFRFPQSHRTPQRKLEGTGKGLLLLSAQIPGHHETRLFH